ncbi:MAG: M48 family metallopeptidase [Chitinophagales bacterium]
MKKQLLLLFLLGSMVLQAQDYTPLESKGDIPEDFLLKSSEKIEAEIEDFTEGSSKKEKKVKEEFLVESSFSTDDLLRSGRVLFGDSVTNYINKVADKLLAHDKDLRDEISIYTYKSTQTNAFAFNNGIILINLGLIAQLQNESQLAFILAHEISHYVEQDALEKFVEKENIEKGKGIYKHLSYSDKELAKYQYSQDIEESADEHGFELYEGSNYSIESIEETFDVLKYSYLPFDVIPFDVSIFENEYFKIPEEYFLEEVSEIDPSIFYEEADEDRMTHPLADDRKETIQEFIEESAKEGGEKYLVSKSEFKAVQKIARFEMSRLYTLYGAYEESIYNSYLLLQDYPDNFYLQLSIAKNLHMIAIHANEREKLICQKIDIEEDLQGESQQLYYMFDQLVGSDREGLNTMATAYIYKLYKDNQDSQQLENLFNAMAYEMMDEEKIYLKDLKTKVYVEKEEPVEAEESEEENVVEEESEEEAEEQEIEEGPMDEKTSSKYDKIKEKEKEEEEEKSNKYDKIKEQNSEESKGEYYEYAFIDYLQDDLFTDVFEKQEEVIEEEKTAKKEEISSKKKKNEDVESLDIEKIVVVDPFYAKVGLVDKDNYDHFESEDGQVWYSETLEKMGEKKAINIDIELLDPRNAKESDVETLQSSALIKEWFSEIADLDESVQFSNIEPERIEELVEEFGTEYFMWSGAISIRENSFRRKIGMIMAGVYFPPSLLYTIPHNRSMSHYMLHFNILYNVKTGEMVYVDYTPLNYKKTDALLKAKTYSTLDKISKL